MICDQTVNSRILLMFYLHKVPIVYMGKHSDKDLVDGQADGWMLRVEAL